MLNANIGSVRIDFAQPFSLQVRIILVHTHSHFTLTLHTHTLTLHTCTSSLDQEYILSAHISSLSLLELSNLSYSSSGVNLVEHTQRRLVTAASHHIVYG